MFCFPLTSLKPNAWKLHTVSYPLTTHGIFCPAYWRLQHEIGDGACGFRAIARHFLGDPELHYQIRQQLVQYMSENRHNNDLHIYEGINVELLYGSGMQPFTYHSYDDYLTKMSAPYTYMGQPEMTAVSAFYGK